MTTRTPPANVAETTRLLTEAGIAGLILDSEERVHFGIRPSATTCLLWVEVAPSEGAPIGPIPFVIIQWPSGPTLRYAVEPGDGFGRYGDPDLSPAQRMLVEQLAAAWLASNPA